MRASPISPFATAAICCVLAAAATAAVAQAGSPAAPHQAGGKHELVSTRAVVQSFFEEDAGQRRYVRLKLVPRARLPFTTLAYRVLDPRLVAGLKEGESVAFRAERRDGENVLTAIRVVAPCRRFQPCE